MDEITIEDVTSDNVDKSSFVCMNEANQPEEDVRKGCLQKRRWLEKRLIDGVQASKIGYLNNQYAGVINFEHDSEQKIILIDCVWIPKWEFWNKGVATKLLGSLIEYAKKPIKLFGDDPAKAITVMPFDGGSPKQQRASQFYKHRGFLQTSENPEYLYLPLKEGFIFHPEVEAKRNYIPQDEDKDKLVIIDEPSFCPLNYYIGRRMGTLVKKIDPKIEVRWIDKFEQPDEVKKRGGISGGIINGHHIQSFVFDEKGFTKEVEEFLKK